MARTCFVGCHQLYRLRLFHLSGFAPVEPCGLGRCVVKGSGFLFGLAGNGLFQRVQAKNRKRGGGGGLDAAGESGVKFEPISTLKGTIAHDIKRGSRQIGTTISSWGSDEPPAAYPVLLLPSWRTSQSQFCWSVLFDSRCQVDNCDNCVTRQVSLHAAALQNRATGMKRPPPPNKKRRLQQIPDAPQDSTRPPLHPDLSSRGHHKFLAGRSPDKNKLTKLKLPDLTNFTTDNRKIDSLFLFSQP